MRQIILYPGEDGFWVVECPSLPGCVSQGEDKAKAVSNIREAGRVPVERDTLYRPVDRSKMPPPPGPRPDVTVSINI